MAGLRVNQDLAGLLSMMDGLLDILYEDTALFKNVPDLRGNMQNDLLVFFHAYAFLLPDAFEQGFFHPGPVLLALCTASAGMPEAYLAQRHY